MTVKELFDFVTDPTVRESNVDEYLDRAMQIASTRTFDNNEKVDEEVSAYSDSIMNWWAWTCTLMELLSLST